MEIKPSVNKNVTEAVKNCSEVLVNETIGLLKQMRAEPGQDKMAQIRQLWESLTDTEQVDLMVEFYYGLMDGEKDRFLRETENG